ncbi:ankyrin repeat domain-containing protein [Planctomycetota bacterium]
MRTSAWLLVSLILVAGSNSNANNAPKPTVKPDPENTWTSDAIQRSDVAAIKERALSKPEYLTQRDYYGDTPLMTAIAGDNSELVEFLLKLNADPNVEADDGYTCLLTAIESDAEESAAVVQLLLAAGADIHGIGTNGWTPLHMAAARGHVEKCRLLINAGADVNRRKEIDASETPLMEAAFSGQPETTQLLLEFGADPNMRDTIHNRTPVEIARDAAKGPDPEVVEFLKKENIQIDSDEMFAEMDLSEDQLEQMKQMVGNIDMTQTYIDSSTELAETGDHASVIQILESHATRR